MRLGTGGRGDGSDDDVVADKFAAESWAVSWERVNWVMGTLAGRLG